MDVSRVVGPPDFLTAEEAGLVLRIGRASAYREARRFEATGGAAGIPVERIGKQYRVPRRLLEAKLGGPITWPPITVPATPVSSPTLSRPSSPPRTRRTRD